MFRLPPIPTAQDLLDTAFRRAKKARGTGRTTLGRARDRSLKAIRAFGETLQSGLRGVYRTFPSIENLPPFYRDLLEVVAGIDETRRNLASLKWAEDQVRARLREARAAIRRGDSKDDVDRARKACYGRVASILEEVDPALSFLRAHRQELRRIPKVDPALPTLVIAGAPNVGKSQLVRAMSRARPTVASYPFTTLELSLGHFEAEGRRIQVLDTPGLLDRPLSERNEMERKALVALRHVANRIVFLLDPTSTSGYPLEEQEALLQDLRQAFPEIPFLEVENKADLSPGTGTRRRVSARTGRGVDGLIQEAVRSLTSPAPASEPPREAR